MIRPDAPIEGASAWRAQDFENDRSWLHPLTPVEVDEIEAAADHAAATGKSVTALKREDFPLPSFAPHLAAIRDEVERGRGFALLRGIRLRDYSQDEAQIIFWGLGQHLGTPIVQNPQGALLHEIKDLRNDYHGNNVRGHSTNARLRPHVDPCDIVGLFCIHPAMSGGVSTITSAVSIYNDILKNRPEFLAPLSRGFRIDYAGKGPNAAANLCSPQRIPVFSERDGAFTCYYNAKQIENGAEKTGDGLTALERDAVLYVEEAALRPDLQFNMGFETGDIQLLNNYTILHARTAYEDWPENDRKRLLLRLWLNVPDGRPLLPSVADRLGTGPRGGVNPYAAETRPNIP